MKYIIDIDGTLLDGEKAIDGAVQFIEYLTSNKKQYLLMTNSIKSREVQFQRLKNAGFSVAKESILNPIVVINQYIKAKKIANVKIIGSSAEIAQVNAKNVSADYELVILLDFEKINAGYSVIQGLVNDIENGTEIITASLSLFYLKGGKKAVDTGSFVKLLEEITNVRIKNFGKPSIEYFRAAENILKTRNEDIFVIGDDWRTDIVGANEYGAKGILVKTGKYTKNDEQNCTPYKIIDNLCELVL